MGRRGAMTISERRRFEAEQQARHDRARARIVRALPRDAQAAARLGEPVCLMVVMQTVQNLSGACQTTSEVWVQLRARREQPWHLVGRFIRGSTVRVYRTAARLSGWEVTVHWGSPNAPVLAREQPGPLPGEEPC